ncbi:MAG: hypothetical protein WC498_02465 [Candidatus Saccharimonadales bacterium]
MKTKTKNLHRQIHPIHWHGSMFVAIAALLITATKSSSDMLRFLNQTTAQANLLNSLYLRDAENIHLPVILVASRHTPVAGK